jgi:hypothetical protein
MSYFYIPNPVNKTDYIGNSLSAFNQSFSALDVHLYELSGSVDSINSQVQQLSTEVFGVTGLPIATSSEAINMNVENRLMNPKRTIEAIQEWSSPMEFYESIYPGYVNFYVDSGDRYVRIEVEEIPPVPDIEVEYISSENIQISWTTLNPSLSSWIYKSEGVDDFLSSSLIAIVAPNVDNYFDASFSPGESYYYWLVYNNGPGFRSEPSPSAFVSIPSE